MIRPKDTAANRITKPSINGRDEHGDTLLLKACKKRDYEKVHALLDKEANPDLCDMEGRSPLHWSAEMGDIKMLELLIKSGANLNAHDHQNDTPVLRAIKQDHVEAVRLLIDAGCDWHDVDGLNSTSLTLASLLGRCRVVKLLLEKGDDVDEIGDYGMTPLMCATLEGHLHVTRILLDYGADPNAIGRYSGASALLNASYIMDEFAGARHDIVRLLLQSNADPNQTVCAEGDSMTRTASGLSSCLHYAVLHGYLSFIQMYLLSGLRVNHSITKQLIYGEVYNLLHYWASNPKPLTLICRILIRKKIGLNVQKKIPILGVPSQIRNYLMLKELDRIAPKLVKEGVTMGYKTVLFRCSNTIEISRSYLQSNINSVPYS